MARNAVAIVFFLVALGAVAASPRTLIVLDPGHSPAKMGAIGARGEGEYAYNDRLAADLMRRLTQRGFDVRLTRTPQAEIDLAERAQLANRSGAAVFVALHHDSANPKYLTETTVQGRKAYVVTGELRKKYQRRRTPATTTPCGSPRRSAGS
jgi:N-acetylmuramoyl-L-alanine amidase